MKFTQTPSAVTFAATMPRFIVAEVPSSSVSVELKKGNSILLNETAFKIGSTVELDLAAVVNNSLTVAVPTSDFYVQSNGCAKFSLTVSCSGATPLSYSFTAIKGGSEGLELQGSIVHDGTSWFLATWQPNVKKTTINAPEFLTYYIAPVQATVLRIRCYDAQGVVIKTVASGVVTTDGLYTFDLSYSAVHTMANSIVFAYYDVDLCLLGVDGSYTYIGSPVQRYLPMAENPQHKYYLFENCVGGIDTLITRGALTKKVSLNAKVSTANNEMIDTANTSVLAINQVVGIFSSDIEVMWFRDFILSAQRYVVEDGACYSIIIDDSDVDIDLSNASLVSFSYRRAKESKYSGFIRHRIELPVSLVFRGPDDTNFF